MTDKEAWHINQGYSDSIDYMGEDEELTDLRNDSSMQGLLKYNYATADATGVAHDNIDAELANNRQEKLEKIILQSKEEGSIRALPYLETAEGKQTILDLVTGSPGAAIGRVSKAAVTGGQRLFPKAGQKLVDLFKKIGREPVKGRGMDISPGSSHAKYNQIGWNNKVNASRLAREKAFNKYGLPHQRGNPAQPEEPLPLMDSVSELLHALRFRKN